MASRVPWLALLTLVACGPQVEPPADDSSTTGTDSGGTTSAASTVTSGADETGSSTGPEMEPEPTCLGLSEMFAPDEGVLRYHAVDSDDDGIDEVWMTEYGMARSRLHRLERVDGTWEADFQQTVDNVVMGFEEHDGVPHPEAMIHQTDPEPPFGQLYFLHMGLEGGFEDERRPIPWPYGTAVTNTFDLDQDGLSDALLWEEATGLYQLWRGDAASISTFVTELDVRGSSWAPASAPSRHPVGWLAVGELLEPEPVEEGVFQCTGHRLSIYEPAGDALLLAGESNGEATAQILDVADLDGDGRPEVLTRDCQPEGIRYYDLTLHRSQPGGDLVAEPIDVDVTWVGVADFDGDGRMDLAGESGGALWWRRGVEGGVGEAEALGIELNGEWDWTWRPRDRGDFDGDGREELMLVRDEELMLLGAVDCP